MRNYRGEIAECTTSNLFVIRDGTALTPPLDAGLLAGITREFVFDIGADVGIPVEEAVLPTTICSTPTKRSSPARRGRSCRS